MPAGRFRRSTTAPPACRKSTATSRSTGTSAPDRCSSRSRASTPSSCSRPGWPPVSARTTSASIAASGGGGAHRLVPARRPARAAGAGEPVVPLEQRQPARAQVGRGLVREIGAVGLHGRRRERTAACWSTPPTSCCATCTGAGSALRPGNYRVDRTRSAFYLPRTKAFPKNTEIEMTLTFANDAAGGRGGGGGGPAQGPGPIPASGGGRRRRRRRRTRRRPVLGHRSPA